MSSTAAPSITPLAPKDVIISSYDQRVFHASAVDIADAYSENGASAACRIAEFELARAFRQGFTAVHRGESGDQEHPPRPLDMITEEQVNDLKDPCTRMAWILFPEFSSGSTSIERKKILLQAAKIVMWMTEENKVAGPPSSFEGFPFLPGDRLQHVSGSGPIFILQAVLAQNGNLLALREDALDVWTEIINPGNWKRLD